MVKNDNDKKTIKYPIGLTSEATCTKIESHSLLDSNRILSREKRKLDETARILPQILCGRSRPRSVNHLYWALQNLTILLLLWGYFIRIQVESSILPSSQCFLYSSSSLFPFGVILWYNNETNEKGAIFFPFSQ